MKKELKRQAQLAVVYFALLGTITYSLHMWAVTPEVHKSYSTSECVKVIEFTEEKEYSCENLPERFVLVHSE
jgi:replication initiation and membrane attachment protein DnaB